MRDLKVLDKDFKEKFENVLKEVKDKGHVLVPYSTRRNIYTQARLWRQSRKGKEVKRKIQYLKDSKCFYLSEVLDLVGPQHGRWATNAIPGFSWHQHDQAVDCFVLEEGKAIWDRNHKGYFLYYQACLNNKIYSGYVFEDCVHCQNKAGSVGSYYNLLEIDDMMNKKFKLR